MASELKGLHNLKPAKGSTHRRKRVGRGEGSGMGKTSGRGHKGAGARAGAKRKSNFEGGQMPIHMRMRKLKGPHMKKSMPFEKFRTATQPVNLDDLEKRFEKGAEVTPQALSAAGLATRRDVPREGARAAASCPRRSPCTPTPSPPPRARRSRRPAAPCKSSRTSTHAQDAGQLTPDRRHPEEAALRRRDARALPPRRAHPRARA